MAEEKKPRDWTEARFHVTDAIKNDFNPDLMAEAVYKAVLNFAYENNLDMKPPNELVRVYEVENNSFTTVKIVTIMAELVDEPEGFRDHVTVQLWDELPRDKQKWAEGRIAAIDKEYRTPDGEADGEEPDGADWWKKGGSPES